MSAFIKGEPVPLARGENPPCAKLGEPAPEGTNWQPVGDGKWVGARCVIDPPYNLRFGTTVSLYRPAADPNVAVIEVEVDAQDAIGLGNRATVLAGTFTGSDGKAIAVRLHHTDSPGMLGLREPLDLFRKENLRPLFFRFAAGSPGRAELTLTGGRKINLQPRDFPAERAKRIAQLLERVDPARGGPDWSVLDASLVELLALQTGYFATAERLVMDALEPLLPALTQELAGESPVAAEAWSSALADLMKRRDDRDPCSARELAAAWKEARKRGGVPERGRFERIGRRVLRTAGLAPDIAAELETAWRAADASNNPEEFLRVRAETRRHLKDEAICTAIDRALAMELGDAVLRLQKEDKWQGRVAGLALWAHLLGGGKIEDTVVAGAVAPYNGQDMLGIARANAAVLALAVWPVLAPTHRETPRLQAFLGSDVQLAGAPLQAVLGVRPGTPAGFLRFRRTYGDFDPLVLAGDMRFFPSDDAPRLEWGWLPANTDPNTWTNSLIRQHGVVQRARARPGELLSSFQFWSNFYGAPAEELKAITAQRQAAAARQAAALAAAQKAREEWAAAQQRSWDRPQLVADYSAMYVVRGLRTPEMAKLEEKHAEALKQAAAAAGGQDETTRRREFELMERLRAQRELADLPKLMANLKAADATLAQEEATLARLEAAEARRVFHAGPGGHDNQRRAALRAYYHSMIDQWLASSKPSPERQWRCWWFGIQRPEIGELPAELRPEVRWLPEVAATIFEGELHRALALDTIKEIHAAAAAAVDRVRDRVELSRQAAVLAPGVQELRRKLTPDEFAGFQQWLGVGRWSVVQLALQASEPKPSPPATTRQPVAPTKK
ncbi:MAG: hypothetical protein JNL39_19815 [Opitutaceae bacterium]|nr:hypothetical protein [Opitutaceae bacterium]